MARATATPDAAGHARETCPPLFQAQAELEAARRAALAVIGQEAVARLEARPNGWRWPVPPVMSARW